MRVNVTLPPELDKPVSDLAKAERRRLSNMIAMLVAEALAARKVWPPATMARLDAEGTTIRDALAERAVKMRGGG